MSKVNVEKNISPTRAQRVAQDGNLRSGIVRDYYVVDEALLRDGVIGWAVAEAECNTVTGLKQVHHAATPLPLS